MNRRDLVQKIALGSAVLVIAPSVLQGCKSGTGSAAGENASVPAAAEVPGAQPMAEKITLDISLPENASLNSAGGSRLVEDLLIINSGDGNFVALSNICTHEGCIVGYDSAADNVKCNCHGALFTKSGSIISGPVQTPLKSYPITKTDNILTITL